MAKPGEQSNAYDAWVQGLGVSQDSFTPTGPDPDSPEYKRGYADGINGLDANGVPYAGYGLDNYDEGYAKGHYERSQKQKQNAAPATPSTSATMQATGAAPEEEPVSLAVGGLPAFRYNLPNIPIATARVDLPDATVDISLSLRGNVSVTFPNPPKGLSVDQSGFRVEAVNALGPITTGLRINGIGSETPSIGVTMGSQYDAYECRFVPPNTMLFIGQARVNYTVPSKKVGKVAVQGQPGYELRVTVTPRLRPSAVATPESASEWFESHSKALAGIGAIILIGIAIAAAPETGGASLVLLAI